MCSIDHVPESLRCFKVPSRPRPRLFAGSMLLLFVHGILLLAGCAGTPTQKRTATRPFQFGQDTFAYSNALTWHYEFDPESGKTTHWKQKPAPDYTLHCFGGARAARQFFENAVFDPKAAPASEDSYRTAIHKIAHENPRLALAHPVMSPGDANVYASSQAQEKVVKEEWGGAWQSYCQR